MAGNKELIDEIVSPVAVKQVTELDAVIVKLEATFAAAAKQALALTAATGGSTTGSGFAKSAAEGQKAVDKLIASQERLNRTIISNSQAEVDAYNRARQGNESITTAVNSRNRAEAQAASQAAARSTQTLTQQRQQATEFIRARGLIEAANTRLERYRILAAGATDPQMLARYNRQIQQTQTTISQLSNVGREGFDSLGNAIGRSTNYASRAFSVIRQLAYILPGVGIAGIIGFATAPIIDYISKLDIFKKKVSEAAELTKELNDVNKSAATDYGEQSTKLKILYEAATNVNNSQKIRLDAARELQKEFPQTFANLTTEAILTGNVGKSVKDLTADLLEQATARASLNKISELAGKQQEILFQKEKIRIANLNENAKTTEDLTKRVVGAVNFRNKQIGAAPLTKEQEKRAFGTLGDVLAENNKSTAKELAEQDKLYNKLDSQIKFFSKNIKASDLSTIIGNGDGGKADADAAKKAADEAKKRREAALKAAQDAAKELRDLQNEYAKQIEDAQKANEKAYNERQKEIFKNSQATLDQYSQQNLERIEREKSAELTTLADKYAKGKKTVQQYNEEKARIESNAEIDSIAAKIDGVQKQIELEKLFNESTASDEQKLADLQIALSKKVTDVKISDLEKQAAARQRVSDIEKQLADATLTFIQTAVDAGFENRKNQLQKEIEQVDERSSAEIDAVNRSLISNTEKAAKINIINAQADAQKKQLQQEQKKQDIEKAKFDKAISLARIVQATATAEIEALTYLSNPFTAPLYPAIAALIGALGAVQLATVLATPIPAYEDGTTNAKGGASLVGEKGRELVMTPQGASFLTPGTPTIMDIPKGSTVVPHLQTAKMQELQKYTGGQQIDMSEVVRAIEKNKPSNKPVRANGWLNEMRAADRYMNRKKNYFN